MAFPEFVAGTVWLVGAGPGAPGLLTVLGYYALQIADVIVYDALVGQEILAWAGPGAVLEYAGKRGGKPSHNQRNITERLVELAQSGKRVLRLKGGDPFVFGRGGEECQALRAAGVLFRIVPGISAGVGGLAYAGIPVTHRETNHSVIFLTGHDSSGGVPAEVDWQAVATASPVLVMYMAVKNLPEIANKLIAGGRNPEDPVAVVAHATLPNQSVVKTTLGEVIGMPPQGGLPTPSIVVVGAVIDLAGQLGWYTEALRDNGVG
ncbi:MAG TPA: uroporphyrinogen-III C-methyltransferase [Hyphomicrobiaceae bacterium]|nr:uroporphyrinogen-III C-methyltransferase [Hyphomicrobiaceae bacterium]